MVRPAWDPPKMDSSKPLQWLHEAHEYFEFYDEPLDARFRFVNLMLKGEAVDWFYWRWQYGLFSNWDDFVLRFKQRFDPMYYVGHFDQLKRSQPLETSSEDITSLASSIAVIKATVAEIQRNLINNAPQGCAIRDVADTDGLISQTKHVEVQDMVEDTGLVELVEFEECDASIFLDDITSLEGEKDVAANLNSVETVNNIKKVVENECKGIVPCAKILIRQ
ncbi:hypothetical protein CASFOL_025043 [Castilleja foliolosa]|uniref:Plant heme peroxidase family profile domain-containing protein n=1 Tax=Castilleja foliolosa TaxID=1961234 RepID=A0ABD3CSI5_9LAMI